jgi:hypothetical protein
VLEELPRNRIGGAGRTAENAQDGSEDPPRRSRTETRDRYERRARRVARRRRYIDEQAVWALMRFADEPAERIPSRQVSRGGASAGGVERGDFDRAVEELTRDDDGRPDA